MLVFEYAIGGAVCLLGHRDAVHRRHSLQTRGRVDDVAGSSPHPPRTGAEGHEGLSGADADAHLKRQRRILRIQLF